MRKTMYVFAVLLLCSWAWATDVDIWCTDEGQGVVKVWYQANGDDANLPRAFGLDIKVQGGITISDVCALMPDPNGYWIFPGSINVNDLNFPAGTPLGDPNDHSDTQDEANGITVELGSLHFPTGPNSVNAPPMTGAILQFKVDNNCQVTIEENTARGKVVLYDAVDADTNLPSGCDVVIDCFPSDHPDYAQWVTVGKPSCWCYPRQCYGDADNTSEGKPNYWVSTNDLGVMRNAWNTPMPVGGEPNICADFDHNPEGKPNYRVSTNDLTILRNHWQISNGPDPNCYIGPPYPNP
jgi:hypothetical protein